MTLSDALWDTILILLEVQKNFQLEVGDFVAAIYDVGLKPYIGKIVKIDYADVHVTFMEISTSTINLHSMFKWPRNKDEV